MEKTNVNIKIDRVVMQAFKEIIRDKGFTIHGGIQRAVEEYIEKYTQSIHMKRIREICNET